MVLFSQTAFLRDLKQASLYIIKQSQMSCTNNTDLL